MITFQGQYQLAQEIAGVSDTTNTNRFKRDINQGGVMFLSVMNRQFNRQDKYTDIVATQQTYQIPEDALRVREVVANNGNYWIPLVQVPDEHTWLVLNQVNVSGVSTHFFLQGNDEIGLYPIPSYDVSNGLHIIYEPKHLILTEDDFTTGTISVTNNSTTVTHSASGFTAAMVGRYLNVFDSTDGNWYRIASYTNSSTIALENVYEGPTNSAVTNSKWLIGQVMDIPEAYLEAPVDYAIYRYYLRRGNNSKAADFKANFQASLDNCRDTFGASTSSQVIWSDAANVRPYNFIKDTPPTIPH